MECGSSWKRDLRRRRNRDGIGYVEAGYAEVEAGYAEVDCHLYITHSRIIPFMYN